MICGPFDISQGPKDSLGHGEWGRGNVQESGAAACIHAMIFPRTIPWDVTIQL